MGDLEQVDPGEPVREQRWVDALLDVAHQQEPPLPDLAEEDDRDVVDGGPAVRRRDRYLAPDRPQHAQRDLVHRESIPGRETEPRRRPGSAEFAQPRRVAWPEAAHPGFEDAGDTVALQQQREPGDVILVWMAEDDDVDAAVPRWDAPVQLDEQPVRVRPAVDQEPATA